MSLLFFAAAALCFRDLSLRIQETDYSFHPIWKSPYTEDSLVTKVNFYSEGWIQPGHSPLLAHGSKWLHPPMSYTIKPYKKRQCHLYNKTSSYTRLCLATILESYWVGKAIPITPLIKCPRLICKVSVESYITLEASASRAMDVSKEEWSNIVSPRPPPKMNVAIRESQIISTNHVVAGPTHGFLWFKPLYWAVSSLSSYAIYHSIGSNVTCFTLNSIYPILQNNHIKGIVGFFPSATNPPLSLPPLKLIIDY
ncbi:hypothetical protein DSO57_1031119 [Entomophthora muscae]|uniref:Uncharacterized protein n=1 Tax=Entomophthora muscae TaxID=34485 RepID=A0ACC2TMM5_9FUNG|nr:hypothetical protein DSO57_1031119 [Entomophthora muscae]